MNLNKIATIIGVSLYVLLASGCKKFLDEKSDQRLTIPSTVQDLQALLDALPVNEREPSINEASGDDYYLSETDFTSLTEQHRNMYTWQKANIYTSRINDWYWTYTNLYRPNQVFDIIDQITVSPQERDRWHALRGHAAFLRGRLFLDAVSMWALAYDENTASTDPGIPLRLNTDFNTPSTRSSIMDCYEQVLADLKLSMPLLPLTTPHPYRPSRAAAAGLLARTYLWMREYDSCFKYANIALELRSELLDFNQVVATSTYPFSDHQFSNPEDLAHFKTGSLPTLVSMSRAKIDTALIASYGPGDLRRQIYFRANTGANAGTFAFKGSYNGGSGFYKGIATDEVLLMRAECYARQGNKEEALTDLNKLLVNRWDQSIPFVPIDADDEMEALSKVLEERRKELIFRGVRWMDIKRLNKEGAGITLKRKINGEEFILPPNDSRYALPIPEEVILLSGMTQN